MSAEGTSNPFLYDLRLRARNLRSGMLEEGQLKTHLDALQDVADNVVTFEIAQPGVGDGSLDPVEPEAELGAEASTEAG